MSDTQFMNWDVNCFPLTKLIVFESLDVTVFIKRFVIVELNPSNESLFVGGEVFIRRFNPFVDDLIVWMRS